MIKASPIEKYCHLIAIAILVLGLTFYLYRIGEWFMHDDEGGYSYAAWRIADGDVPYRDFLTPQLPLFLYWGGTVVRLFGPSILALRYVTVATTLLAACFIYLTAKQVFGWRVALLCLPLFLLHKDVYFIARFFRPEAYMLLFAAMAMYVFVRSYESHRRWGLFLSGALFGLAVLCKWFAALPAIGCGLFLVYQWLRSRETHVIGDTLALTLGWIATAGTVLIAFQLAHPVFLSAVLEHHAIQGAELSSLQVMAKAFAFYWAYLLGNPAFLLLALLGGATALAGQTSIGTFCVWQIPTAAAFLLLSRGLQDRHLVYLVPSLCVLAALSLERISAGVPVPFAAPRRTGQGAALSNAWPWLALAIALFALAVWPSGRKDMEVAAWDEDDTELAAEYIQASTSADDVVLCDYPGLNFWARRKNTYLGAGLSGGATSSGQIAGTALIREMEADDVQMVWINTSGAAHQLVNLHDYAGFRRYVQDNFHLVRRFQRSYQTFEVYHRDERMPLLPDLAFGGRLSLTGADLGAGTVQAGGTLTVPLRWQALDLMDRDYTVSLRLIDAGGHRYGQLDQPLIKTFSSGWEENQEIIMHAPTSGWASGEVVMDEYEVPTLPGTPPGEYQLAALLYHLDSGEVLQARDGEGTVLEGQYVVGRVTVVRPEQPPALDDVGIHRSLTENLGDELMLLGHGPIAEHARPGESLTVALFWQSLGVIDADWQLLLHLRAMDGSTVAEGRFDVANPSHPTHQWVPGDVVMGQYTLRLDPVARPGEAALALSLLDRTTGGRLLAEDFQLARLQIEGRARQFAVPEGIEHRLEANLGNGVRLLGYDVQPTSVSAGEILYLTLYWQALAEMDTSYTVFTHLLAEDGQIWGQKDSIPAQGSYPTTSWLRDEIIVDHYEIEVHFGAPAGEYLLEIGMYDAASGERLPVLDTDGQRADNRIVLSRAQVNP